MVKNTFLAEATFKKSTLENFLKLPGKHLVSAGGSYQFSTVRPLITPFFRVFFFNFWIELAFSKHRKVAKPVCCEKDYYAQNGVNESFLSPRSTLEIFSKCVNYIFSEMVADERH